MGLPSIQLTHENVCLWSSLLSQVKDLQGEIHEAKVYALDTKNAKDLAIDANEVLRNRPHLITAIPH